MRAMREWALAVLLLIGCRSTFELVPATPAEVRRGMAAAKEGDETKVVVHAADASVTWLDFGSLARRCVPGQVCPLDDPAARFELGRYHDELDVSAVVIDTLGLAAVGGLVYGNVKCFSGECGTGGKVAVGIADGVIVLSVVLVLVAAAHWSNFRGD